MSAFQTRQRPTCEAGREVEHQIDLAAAQLYGDPECIARAGYRGVVPPRTAASPRDPLTISGELYAAAECLADFAEDFGAGAFDDRALSSADRMLIGCGRLIAELRQRREARP